jgi:hypothetical protein
MASPSVTEQMMEYLAAKLTAATGFTFYRSREGAVGRSEGLVGILEEDEQEDEYQATTRVMSTIVAKVTVIARATSATPAPSTIADPARVAIHAAIMTDQTLGGLAAVTVPEGTKWTLEKADRTALEVEMRFKIRYATRIADLTQSA